MNLDKKILNKMYLKYTEEMNPELKRKFKKYVVDHVEEHTIYSDNPYKKGEEKMCISDAYDNFMEYYEDAEFRSFNGIDDEGQTG